MNVYIKTYGCQMNERDSEAAAGMLAARGFTIVNVENEADVLIYNTCSVRDQAERKALGKIGHMKKLKRLRPDLLIGVMGCMAQNRGEEIIRDLPHVDFVIGTGQLHKLPEILDRVIRRRRPELHLEDDTDVLTGMGAHYDPEHRVTAYIAITRGCNRFCSYCIVPYVRGREISREISDVRAEAEQLADDGIREIMLLGQNVAAFGLGGNINPPPDDVSPFADLLTELNAIPGLKRLRFTSPYPSYFNRKLIDTLAALPKVCRSFHLPLQSGSDRVLKAMNRHYTAAQYLEIVDRIRAVMPDAAFSTDIIVGFPGETGDDFNATREAMRRVGYDNAFIFKYSPRQGTASANLPDDVPQEEKERRNQLLLDDLAAGVERANAAHLGATVEVLVEGVSKRNAERWTGRTRQNKVVIFPPVPEARIGDLILVRIDRTTSMSLYGEYAGKAE